MFLDYPKNPSLREDTMIARSVFAAALLMVTGTAFAQINQPKGPADGMPTGNESSWQMMTETQVKDRMQREGYTDINITEDGPNKSWSGTARKDGKVHNVKVDSTGKVEER
jgi:hypothetical protein